MTTYFFTSSQSKKKGNNWINRTVNVWKVVGDGIQFLASKTEGSTKFDQLAQEVIAEAEPEWKPLGGTDKDAQNAVQKASHNGTINIIQLD